MDREKLKEIELYNKFMSDGWETISKNVLEEDGTNENLRKEKMLRHYIFTDQYGGRQIKEALIETEQDLILEEIGLTSNTYASSFIDDDKVRSESISNMIERVENASLGELESLSEGNINLEEIYKGVE